jgi:hypothetical protein
MKLALISPLLLLTFSLSTQAGQRPMSQIGKCVKLEDGRKYIEGTPVALMAVMTEIWKATSDCQGGRFMLPGAHLYECHFGFDLTGQLEIANAALVKRGYPSAYINIDAPVHVNAYGTFGDLRNAYFLTWAEKLCK